MIIPSLSISINRTGMSGSPAALVFTAARSADLVIVDYSPPALQRRVTYAPDSVDINGSEAIASSWQQALLGFSFYATADDETTVLAAYRTVAAAIAQFSFPVTTQVSDAPAEVWAADSGNIVLAAGSRSFGDLANTNPVYNVTIPVRPVPA